MKRTLLSAMPAALALALSTTPAHAGDEPGFHGYIRAGAGSSSAKGPQSCYGLGGNTMKYRLGNECDAFGEFGYTHELVKTDDGVSFLGTVWADVYSPNSDFGDAKLGMSKAYVEVRGLDFLNGGTAWAGKRHYSRPDIHMLDLQYINLNGTGAGIDRVPVGPGKLSYAFFKDNDVNHTTADGVRTTTAATRQNLLYQDLPVNTDGTLDAILSVITAQGGAGTHNGYQLSLFHKQANVLGGINVAGVQYGVGPGSGVGVCCDRMGPSGSTLLGSDVTRLRVFDSLWIQPTSHFGVEMVALAQRDRSDLGGTTNWASLGMRPVYAVTNNIKLALELGTDRVRTAGGPTQRLTKITFAPSIAAGPGLWSRPELRAFVTYARWNDAAREAVNLANNSGPVYGNRNSGASYGVQLETWF
jgi:maltoporin